MRKAFLACSVFLIINFCLPSLTFNTLAKSDEVLIHAESAALIDVSSGKILYSKQGNKQMRIASLTKVMTAIVAIEQGTLSDAIEINKRAFAKEGSSLFLQLGERMSLQNMLYGLMLRSGNDAATAIAEHIGGSEEGFSYLMNEKAIMLGMNHSHFVNPHGLDAKEHYSTAEDMAHLTAYALKNPVFQDIVKTKVKKVPNPNASWNYVWANKNKMLALYPDADGVKTGYTKLAKRCLISSATRGGQQLAVVTLNDSDDWADHSKLLDYGFKNFPLKKLVDKGEQLQPGIVAADSFSYPLTAEETNNLTRRAVINKNNHALPVRLGTLGELKLFIADRQIGTVPLVSSQDSRVNRNTSQAFSFQPSESQIIAHNSLWESIRSVLYALLVI
jgi:D-alanyl-D-alanine carboxypeptidase (penicillin-binding protein 5/6)